MHHFNLTVLRFVLVTEQHFIPPVFCLRVLAFTLLACFDAVELTGPSFSFIATRLACRGLRPADGSSKGAEHGINRLRGVAVHREYADDTMEDGDAFDSKTIRAQVGV